MLSSGQLLAERYKLTNRIAVGGMGEVWQASDTRLDRTVAVKVLKAELSGDPEFLHRFRTEARMTASLNHPGIAAVHDYGETMAGEHEIAYLVMELVEGDPLAGILAREGRISAERTLDILEQAGNGLQAAHEQGLVHRDVKPGNILVTPAGKVKITDFGIAKAAHAAPVTRGGMVMGTAHYIAPEQALGNPAEPASDVYSLAVCGYECLTGHRPFLSENAVTVAMMHIRDMPPPLPPDVSPAARAVIEATLIKDPRQRYNSGGEFAAAVAAVRAGHPLPLPACVAARGGYVTMPSNPMPPNPMPPNPMPPNPMPSNPMAPIGPLSHPAMHPVPPSSGIMSMPPPPPRRSHTGLWVALAVILVALVVGGVLVIAKLVSTGNGDQPVERQPTTAPTPLPTGPQQVRPAEPTSGPPDETTQGQTENNGSQGMINTPWTEWNGTQR
jgi:serine/threonine protein kinase